MSLLTRKTSNDLNALLELPGNLLLDYYKQVEHELIEEQKERKRQQEKQKAHRESEARRQRSKKLSSTYPKTPRAQNAPHPYARKFRSR